MVVGWLAPMVPVPVIERREGESNEIENPINKSKVLFIFAGLYLVWKLRNPISKLSSLFAPFAVTVATFHFSYKIVDSVGNGAIRLLGERSKYDKNSVVLTEAGPAEIDDVCVESRLAFGLKKFVWKTVGAIEGVLLQVDTLFSSVIRIRSIKLIRKGNISDLELTKCEIFRKAFLGAIAPTLKKALIVALAISILELLGSQILKNAALRLIPDSVIATLNRFVITKFIFSLDYVIKINFPRKGLILVPYLSKSLEIACELLSRKQIVRHQKELNKCLIELEIFDNLHYTKYANENYEIIAKRVKWLRNEITSLNKNINSI